MRLRTLLRGSLLYTIGNFLPRVGAFLLLPVYTAAMGPEQFGVFSLMLSVSGVLGIVYRLGLDGALMRIHFDVDERERPALYATLALTTLGAGLAFSLLLAAITAPVFGVLFPGVPFWPFGPLTLLLTFLLAFQYVPSTYLRARELPGRFLAFTSAAFGAGVVGTVILLVVFGLGAAGALLGQAFGAAVAVVATVVVVRRLRTARVPGPPVRVDLLRRSVAFGLPLLPHSLSAWVLNLSDRLIIGLTFVGTASAAQAAIGIYSFGYLLGQVVALVAFSFNAAWMPFFYQRGEWSNGPRLLREMTTFSIAGLAVLAAGIGLLAPELAVVLASDRWGAVTRDAAEVTRVVAAASVAYGLYFMVVSPIFLVRRTAALPVLTIAAGTVNVALNFALVPRIGIMGAAWATVAGYAILAALTTWYARRVYPLDLDVPRLTAVVGGLIAVLVGSAPLTEPLAGSIPGAAVHATIALAYAVVVLLVVRGRLDSLRREVAWEPPAGADRMSEARESA